MIEQQTDTISLRELFPKGDNGDEEYDFTIEKSKLSMKIIKLLPNCESFVFGGFVRDFLVREEKFNDLDLFIKNSNLDDDDNYEGEMDLYSRIMKIRNVFEEKLLENQIEIISIKNNRETVDYTIKLEQELLELNIIYENLDNDVPDFDVNNLKFQNGTISQRIPVEKCSVKGIIENITKKQCILLDESLFKDETNYYIRRRIKKMQKKGWLIKNISTSNYNSFRCFD